MILQYCILETFHNSRLISDLSLTTYNTTRHVYTYGNASMVAVLCTRNIGHISNTTEEGDGVITYSD